MAESSINFSGLISSMREIGFTIWQCINEKIENSDSAHANTVKITLRDGKLVIADDGDGMNIEQMRSCGKFHNRSSSSAIKHGTKGVGGNIADINLSGGGRVIYCSKSVASLDVVYLMKLNYDVDTEEMYRPTPDEAPRRYEDEVWGKYALNKTTKGTVQLFETVPEKIYKELVESIKTENIITSYRRIWGLTYDSMLRSGKKIIFDVEGELFNLHPIDMMKYDEIEEDQRHIDNCSIYANNDNLDKLHVYYEKKGKLYYRDYSESAQGKTMQKLKPEEDGFTKIGNFKLTHTYSAVKWRELHRFEMESNGINLNYCTDQELRNSIGGGVVTFARNHKHVSQFPTSKLGESAADIPYHQKSKHLLDYDATDSMDELFNIQINKSTLEIDNIQKEVMRIIKYLNRTFVGKMKSITKKKAEATEATEITKPGSILVAQEFLLPHVSDSSTSSVSAHVSLSDSSSASILLLEKNELLSDIEEDVEDIHTVVDVVADAVDYIPPARIINVSSHTRDSILQNTGIQTLKLLKQQPQYHEAMNDTIDTILVDYCRLITDKRIGRTQTKRLINIGSFENKCDLLCELIQGRYVLVDDTMKYGAELCRKYNTIVNNNLLEE